MREKSQDAYLPFAKLIRMTSPNCKGKLTAMLFKAYIDESSDQPETTFTVGGFIGSEDAWVKLEPQWLAALPPDIGYFHATDCFGGHAKYGDMAIEERKRLLDRLTDLIVDTDIKLIGAGIDVAAYKKFAPKLRRNDFGGNKYVAPFGFTIEIACKDYMNSGSPFPLETNDSCALFIEDGEWAPSARIAITGMREYPEGREWRDRIGTDTYGKKSAEKVGPAAAIPLLQVADLGAFLGNKTLTKPPEGKISWLTYYEKLRLAGRVFLGPMRISAGQLELFYAMYSIRELEAQGIDTWNEL